MIGYQATTVTPANTAPRPQAALPSMMILPVVAFIRSMKNGSCLVSLFNEIFGACFYRTEVEIERLLLLRKLLAKRGMDGVHVDLKQVGHNSDVNHVPDPACGAWPRGRLPP